MSETSARRVVLKYYAFTLTRGPGFIYPVYVLYLLSQGLSFTQIGTISAVQAVILFAGEVPTGYVGDRVGRRNSLALAQVCHLLAAAGMILGSSFSTFVVAFSLLAVGLTFSSGSGSAWLYDTLKERLDESEYTRIRGRGNAISQWGTAATMVLGGGLYLVGHLLPFLALFAMRVVTLLVVLRLPKTSQYADTGGADADADSTDDAESEDGGGTDTVSPRGLPGFLRERLTDPAIRSFVLFMTVVFGAVAASEPYVQPITVNTLEASTGALGALAELPEPALLGVLYAAFTATGGVASDYADDLRARFGLRAVVVGVPLVLAVMLVVPLAVPLLAFPMFFVSWGSRPLLQPLAEQYLNDRIGSADRATLLSAVSMVYGIGRVPFVLGSGVAADLVSPIGAVAVLGGMLLVVGGALFVLRPPVQPAPETPDAGGAIAED